MKIVKYIVLLSLCFAQLMAQDSLSLSEAIVLGLENNYELKMTRNEERISNINNTWGNTSLMPSIALSASAFESWNLNDTENYREQTIQPEVTLDWVIFNGFSAQITKAKYEELEAQSQGNTAILVENTIQDIILAYNNCLLQKELMNVYEELADLSQDRYKRTEESKALGASTSYESLQAKTSWLEDQSNFLDQKVNYDNAVRTLNYILGVQGDPTWVFSSALSVDTATYSIEDLSAKMKSNNETLKNQYLYQRLLAKETQLAKSDYYPSLSLSSGLNNTDYLKAYSGSTANTDYNYINPYVGLTLSWNIFNGGTRKRSVEIAKINEETAEIQVTQMVHSLDNQLLQMHSRYNVNKAILSLAEEQAAAASLNLELSYEKLQSGVINSFNYRDVQIAYMNAAISKLSAYYDLIQSKTDLMRITGSIVDEYGTTLNE